MKRFFTSLFLVLSLSSGLHAQANIQSLFVVGDSLSDNGNIFGLLGFNQTPGVNGWPLIPSAPYAPSNNFTNGPVWSDLLAANLGVPDFNFAFGGARTGTNGGNPFVPPGGLDQLGLILLNFGSMLPSSGLYSVWLGGNDLRDAARAADAATATTIVNDAIQNISGIITGLANAGAINFLVPNAADLSLTPEADLAVSFGLTPFVQDASAITNQFNSALASSMTNLESTLGVNITLLDTFGAVNAMVADPAGFGFTDVDNPCLQIGGSGVCSNPDEYLFWDGLHPTAAVHAQTAALATAAVVPVPAALPLFLSALAIFGVWSRRKGQG